MVSRRETPRKYGAGRLGGLAEPLLPFFPLFSVEGGATPFSALEVAAGLSLPATLSRFEAKSRDEMLGLEVGVRGFA